MGRGPDPEAFCFPEALSACVGYGCAGLYLYWMAVLVSGPCYIGYAFIHRRLEVLSAETYPIFPDRSMSAPGCYCRMLVGDLSGMGCLGGASTAVKYGYTWLD